MAANGHRPARQRGPRAPRAACLSAEAILQRLDEEIARAQRLEGRLCCLLVRMNDFDQVARTHGIELAEAALVHAGEALIAELRRYDRLGRLARDELLLLLPGAQTGNGEAVARRALRRMMAIKIEVGRVRVPLSISVGIASWQASWSSPRLIEETRAATGASPRHGSPSAEPAGGS